MARPRIIYNNLWRKGTGVLPSSPVAEVQHPVTDSQIDTKSMYFQSSTLAHPLELEMDLGGVKEVNFVAILGHNFADIGSGLTLQFQLASNNTFDANLKTIVLTYAADNMFKFFTAWSRQFVRLKVIKGSNFDVKPKVGTILCGSYFELNRSERPGYERGHEDPSVIEEGDESVIFTQEKPRIEVGSFSFEGINDVTQAEILNFIEEVGIHKAFVLCFDYTDANNESMWVRNSEISIPRWQGIPNCWAWELRTREIV